jgi:hypothetical protein
MQPLSESQKATNYETLKHIELVMQLLETMKHELSRRQFSHDRSKLESPEMEMFEQFTHRLAGMTYGSDEYKECLEEMKRLALGHHYENNRHHPEHYPNGIEGMNLIDMVEMVCDWQAASKRHGDGNIYRSIEINTDRFNLSPQLVQILKNTVPLLTNVYSANTQKHLH